MTRKRRMQVPSLLEENPLRWTCRGDAPGRRFLFVVPPLAGHVNPTVAVGAALARRGHRVAWAGHRASVAPLLEPGARLYPVGDKRFTARLRAARQDWLAARGAAALRILWEEFIVPLGHAMMAGVDAAVEEFRPDVIVTDQQALAGAVVARRRDLPWVTSATTSAELTRPLAGLPKVAGWVAERLAEFQEGYRIEPMDLRFSDHLVLVFSTAALLGDTEMFPGHYAFVGPALGRPPGGGDFPLDWLTEPSILISLGTVNGPAGGRFFHVAAETVRDMDLRAVCVAPPGMLAAPPPNVLVRAHVPQLALLPRLSAVVSHGGHNTVCESLAHGLPLVVAPIRDDQSIIARQVAAAGAGVTVRFARIRPEELRAAITTVLSDGAYRAAARAVQSSFAAAGGAAQAADRLEKVA
jgi:MGT family glycosyltransferase